MAENSFASDSLPWERSYVYVGICYIILFIKYVSCSYISENCFISTDFNKVRLDNNELIYRTDGDILEMYYKENKAPFKYHIVGNKHELAKMLYRNYHRNTK